MLISTVSVFSYIVIIFLEAYFFEYISKENNVNLGEDTKKAYVTILVWSAFTCTESLCLC